MITAEHVAAVETAIDAAGGPDRVRFCPVAIELVEQGTVERPVIVAVREGGCGLVDLWFSEVGLPEATRDEAWWERAITRLLSIGRAGR